MKLAVMRLSHMPSSRHFTPSSGQVNNNLLYGNLGHLTWRLHFTSTRTLSHPAGCVGTIPVGLIEVFKRACYNPPKENARGCLSEVQGFSVARAFASLLLVAILIGGPILLAVIGIVLMQPRVL
jgi:hypothetical protein